MSYKSVTHYRHTVHRYLDAIWGASSAKKKARTSMYNWLATQMNISTEELTERLKYLDKAIQELHENGYYVVSDLAEIDIINNEVTLDSFKDKIDYLNSGINENGRNKDILELCSIGICAYNKLSVLQVFLLLTGNFLFYQF